MTFTQEDKRDKIRSQLKYELFGAATAKQEEKKPDKSNIAIPKQPSKKAKFLQNPNTRPQKGDVPDYMPAPKRG